jgi:hypothetical protein
LVGSLVDGKFQLFLHIYANFLADAEDEYERDEDEFALVSKPKQLASDVVRGENFLFLMGIFQCAS